MAPRQNFKARAFYKGYARLSLTASVTSARKVISKRNASHYKKQVFAYDPAMVLFGLNQNHFNVDFDSKVLIRDACIMQLKDIQRQQIARQELKHQDQGLEYMGKTFMADALRSQASEAEESLKATWAAEEDEQILAWELANSVNLKGGMKEQDWYGSESYSIRDGVVIALHEEDDSTEELEELDGLFGGLSAGDDDMMDEA